VPVTLTFDKRRAQDLLARLLAGRALLPPDGGWSDDDLLLLAGVAQYLALTRAGLARPGGWAGGHREHAEAEVDTLCEDLAVALEWVAHATMLVADGNYDELFEPVHRAEASARGGRRVTFTEGRKGE
jgi:hypothetical protein